MWGLGASAEAAEKSKRTSAVQLRSALKIKQKNGASLRSHCTFHSPPLSMDYVRFRPPMLLR